MLGSDLLKPVGCVTSAPAVHGAVMARQAPDKKASADAEGYASNRVFCWRMVLAGAARSAVPVWCQMMMLHSAAISQRQQEPGPPVQRCKGHFTPRPTIITTSPHMISPHHSIMSYHDHHFVTTPHHTTPQPTIITTPHHTTPPYMISPHMISPHHSIMSYHDHHFVTTPHQGDTSPPHMTSPVAPPGGMSSSRPARAAHQR